MNSSSQSIKYKKVNEANADENASLSSYASVDSVQIETTNKTENNNGFGFDFSSLLKPRTVISFSAKNNSPVSLINEQNSLDLHQAVFANDIKKVKWLIDRFKRANSKQIKEFLSVKDKHENTALHLACMLGHLEITKLLANNGATVKIRNLQMWTPLNEAISYGNRDLVRVVLKKFEKEVETIVDDAKPKVVEALKELDDFYIEVKWDFESWIPFVSRFLPSDTCKIRKKGTKLRLDCTLGDIAAGQSGQNKESAANSVGASISPFRWDRGDLSFLFEIEKVGSKNSIVFLNNSKKTYLIVDKHQIAEPDLEREIDLLLSKEMVFVKLNTKQALFTPTQIGWVFNKRDKIEQLNGYLCHFYDVQHLYIVTKLRVEHLSDEELKKREEKQLKIKKHLSSGLTGSTAEEGSNEKPNLNDEDVRGLDDLKDLEEEIQYRPSLPPPPPNQFSWMEYESSQPGDPPILGRKPKCKESRKEFKAQIAMSQEFPLSINDLNKLLDALVPLAKFRKLKEFISLKLPPGFPVKIDIPIVPAISAKVCFQNFQRDCVHNESLFKIPSDYKEEILISPEEAQASKF